MQVVTCTNCGAEISEEKKFCTNCGTKVAAAAPPPIPPPQTIEPVQPLEPVQPVQETQSQSQIPTEPITPIERPPLPVFNNLAPFPNFASPLNNPPALGVFGYVWRLAVMCIPVIGWIIAIVMSLGNGNKNSKNLARAMLVLILIGILIVAAVMLLCWLWSVTAIINMPDKGDITFGFL